MNEAIYTRVGNKLLLGIGRPYTATEKKEIKKYAKENGFNVPNHCPAGIYLKQPVNTDYDAQADFDRQK